MAFAYCPEGGLPRLLRFDLTEPHIVARLDRDNNLLLINRELFDKLDSWQRKEVEKTLSAEVLAS